MAPVPRSSKTFLPQTLIPSTACTEDEAQSEGSPHCSWISTTSRSSYYHWSSGYDGNLLTLQENHGSNCHRRARRWEVYGKPAHLHHLHQPLLDTFSPLTWEEGFGARGFLVSGSKHGHLVSGINSCWSVFMKAVEARTTLIWPD